MGDVIEPTMHVARDGTVTWKVLFRLGKGRAAKKGSRTFDSDRKARRFAEMVDSLGIQRALEVYAARAADQADPDHVPTVTEWCLTYIDSLTKPQKDTLDRYRSVVRNDFAPRWGKTPIDTLTDDDVKAWVKAMAAAGASQKTMENKLQSLLSPALKAAVTKGLITKNVAAGVEVPRTESEPMTFLTHEEYARFLGCFTPYWQPLVAFLFSTGLRWAEATALRVGDVDLAAGTARVERAWKRGRTLGPPKSPKSRRTVALAPETVEVLRPLIEGRPADGWVFRNQRGDAVRHQTFHDNVWTPAVRLANGEPAQAVRKDPKTGKVVIVGKRVARRLDANGAVIKPLDPPMGKRPRPHDARHSCASWMLGAGVPVNYVQAHLGHESIKTTVDRYGHVMPGARAAVRAALSLALAPAHPQIEA